MKISFVTKKKTSERVLRSSHFYLNGTSNVETLLHARDVKLDHSQVFTFDYDGSNRADKSEQEVVNTFVMATVIRLRLIMSSKA